MATTLVAPDRWGAYPSTLASKVVAADRRAMQSHFVKDVRDSMRNFLGAPKFARERSWTHNQFSDEHSWQVAADLAGRELCCMNVDIGVIVFQRLDQCTQRLTGKRTN